MTDLPLQRNLTPWPPTLRRIGLLLVLALVVVLAGWLSPRRHPPLELILSGHGHEGDYAREGQSLIAGAKTRVWLAMYVIRPDDQMVGDLLDSLAAAVKRGVDVRVCLDHNSPNDRYADDKHVAAEAWLRAHKVHVVLDEVKVITHVKLMIVDSQIILAGSHNWTRPALSTNREASWRIEDAELASRLEAWLAQIPGW